MATNDDTSKHRHSRRNQTPATAGQPPDSPPRTLEEAIEDVRTLLLQVGGVLHCLSDVLQYADDDDSVMHAEVARSAAGWANLAAEKLDRVKMQSLIEAVRQRGGGEPGEGAPEAASERPYQVREPMAMYLV